jgi:hypothetical protein
MLDAAARRRLAVFVLLLMPAFGTTACWRDPANPMAPRPPQTISIDGPDASPEPSETAQFQAIGHYPDGSTRDLSNWADWASSNSSVAAVSSSGLVAAIAPGVAVVSAKYGGVAGNRQFEVVSTGAGRRERGGSSTSEPGGWTRRESSEEAERTPARELPSSGVSSGHGGVALPQRPERERTYTGSELLIGLGKAIWADVTFASAPARQRAATLYLGRAVMYGVWTTSGLVLVVAGLSGLLHGGRGFWAWVALLIGVPVGLVGPAISRLGGWPFEIAQVLTLLICLTLALPAISLKPFGAGNWELRRSRRVYLGIFVLFLTVLAWAVWSLRRNPPLF